MVIQHLIDAAWVGKTWVRFILPCILRLAAAVLAVSSTCFGVSWHIAHFLSGRSRVKPGLGIVFLLFFVPAGEEPVEIFGVAKVLAQDGRCIGVVDNVLAKLLAVCQDVVNQRPQKDNVAAGTQRDPYIRHGRRARES